MRIMGRMLMCRFCTLDLKNELLIIHVLALLFARARQRQSCLPGYFVLVGAGSLVLC